MACFELTCETTSRTTRCIYLSLYLVWFAGAWLLRNYGEPMVSGMKWYQDCLVNGSNVEACVAKQSVLRVSFGCFLFHLSLLASTLGVTDALDPRRLCHNGFWPVKFILAVGLFFLPFAFPSTVVSGYGQLARVLAGFFILAQLILLLDAIFAFNGYLIDRRCCILVLVTVTSACFAGWITALVFAIKAYAAQRTCSLHVGLITTNVILSLAVVIVSVQPYRLGSSGLLTAGVVLLYCVLQLASALSSSPNACNQVSATASEAVQIISFVLVVLALLSATFSSSTGIDKLGLDVEAPASSTTQQRLSYRPDAFHLMYSLSGCYMAMLLLNWKLVDGSTTTWAIDRGYASTWIKFASMLLCMALYTWVLLAPHLLPQREFVL